METVSKKHTLCWSCANATGGCSWSDHWEHTPVKGWVAQKSDIKYSQNEIVESYIVLSCPKYIQDSLPGGLGKLNKQRGYIIGRNSYGEIAER